MFDNKLIDPYCFKAAFSVSREDAGKNNSYFINYKIITQVIKPLLIKILGWDNLHRALIIS